MQPIYKQFMTYSTTMFYYYANFDWSFPENIDQTNQLSNNVVNEESVDNISLWLCSNKNDFNLNKQDSDSTDW